MIDVRSLKIIADALREPTLEETEQILDLSYGKGQPLEEELLALDEFLFNTNAFTRARVIRPRQK